MSLYDFMPKTAQQKMFENMDFGLQEKLLELAEKCKLSIDEISLAFKDPDFLKNFFEIVPLEEQGKYMLTSYLYEHGKDYDSHYLMVYRRAIYTKYEKNENFWTTEFNSARFGLRKEQPLGSPIRLYSSIMVTTMDKLINHGLEITDGGATDGEITLDPSKTFNDFLLVYKPEDEKVELEQYISSGGISYIDLIKKLEETSKERMEKQGYHR